jgi:uncharacterized protein
VVEYSEAGGALTFRVSVVPRASKSALAGEHGGALKVRVAAPPVEGAANDELTRMLAKAFGVPARSVEIVGGATSKSKVVRVRGVTAAHLLRLAAGDS